MKRFTLTLFLLAVCSTGIIAARLTLTPGTMTLGGKIALQYRTNDLKTTWSWNYFSMAVDANWGYFVANQTALLINMKVAGPFGTDVYDARRAELGFGGMYLLTTDTILYPYFQLIGYTAYRTSGWSLGVRPAFGALLAMSDTWALDLGIDAMFDFAIPNPSSVIFEVGMGYLGVRGFF